MQLTYFSDYSLRVLIYLAVKKDKASIAEISRAFGISKNHLVKTAQHLIKLGYISSIRGKTGGITLAKPPRSINLGKIIQQLEPHMDIVECFTPQTKTSCAITPVCRLKSVFQEAKRAFISALEKYSLADIVRNKEALSRYILQPA
ncbi:MAG TPA: Rrf2 family transcriptional regulator [Candidatus Omnitrophota bacterium]|nr:Rrf2 family transcriptional regulator [Candidatus Omnitrophota bacterium]